jgi:hypothetical protein
MMRRIAVVGAALLAVLAVSAIGSATAFALPEFLPNPEGQGITLGGKSGAGQLQIQGGGTVKCEKDKVLGQLLTLTHVDIDIHFEGCKALGFQANTPLDNPGVILVKGLALLCYLNKAAKTVGLNVEVTPTLQIEVPTAKQSIEVKGNVIGEVTPVNSKKSTGTVNFTQKEGKPGIEKCEGAAAAVLLAKEGTKEFKPAGEETKEEVEFLKAEKATEVEVMA